MWWVIQLSSASLASPDTTLSCDLLAAQFVDREPEALTQRPQLWWLMSEDPCPSGYALAGNPPPSGTAGAVWCEDKRARRSGMRTTFDDRGNVLSETFYSKNAEVGPRLDWTPGVNPVARVSPVRNGELHGEVVEWPSEGGVLASTWFAGKREGPTWRTDARGRVMMIEHWKNDQRDGRSCTWRDDKIEVDQLFKDGLPVRSP